MQETRPFRMLTIGWELQLIGSLARPIGERTGISFRHGMVGDSRRLPLARGRCPGQDLVSISKSAAEPLPLPDFELLASLEAAGVPTVQSMIQGDRVLRHRSGRESFGYATLLVGNIRAAIERYNPDVVLGTFDNLHGALGLAVARSMGIPWVTMAFTAIPNDLTGFCKGMTPNTLVAIERPLDNTLRRQAEQTMHAVRSRRQQVLAYRPPSSIPQRARQMLLHARNLSRRVLRSKALGVDSFTYPSARERVKDVVRRSVNRLFLSANKLLTAPPGDRFAYFPLHMAPESSVDTWAPFYQNQLGLIAQVSLALPANLELVVKLHFSDPDNYSRRQLQQLTRLPRVFIAHPEAPGRIFLERAELVIGIQGTANLEAALLGKPVLLFGDSPYQYFPRTERAIRPDELHGQICRLLEQPTPSEEQIGEAFAAYMSRYLPGRHNDWSQPLEPVDLDRFAACFCALRSYVSHPVNRANWYREPPFAKVLTDAAVGNSKLVCREAL